MITHFGYIKATPNSYPKFMEWEITGFSILECETRDKIILAVNAPNTLLKKSLRLTISTQPKCGKEQLKLLFPSCTIWLTSRDRTIDLGRL